MTTTAREYGDIAAWEELDGPIDQLNHPPPVLRGT
jgi:hypothetical protein